MIKVIGVRFRTAGKIYFFSPGGLELKAGDKVIVETARGVEFDGGLVKRVRLMVPLCVPLLVSSVRKTNSSAIAAEVRGFYLRGRASAFKHYAVGGFDWVSIAFCVVLLVLAIVQRVML